MATKFSKGQEVKLNQIVPQGEVLALRMDEEGNFFYKVEWADIDGKSQQRWFAEEVLVVA